MFSWHQGSPGGQPGSGQMGPRMGGKRYREEEEMGRSVVFLSSSSDDEEANLDLSLEIVEKARRLEEERNNKRILELSGVRPPVTIDLSSSDEVEAVSGCWNEAPGEAPPAVAVAVGGPRKKKKKKKKRKKSQNKEADEEAVLRGESENAEAAVIRNEEDPTGTAGAVVTGTDGNTSDNIVLRKLLRGPRYFDPGSGQLESCYNCGEEGHVAADCTAEKKKKPCFICGMFGHNANKCNQGQDCFICKRRGHFAKDCPDKHRKTSQDNRICLRCGDLGHDMSSCGNSYPPEDLKKIQCYVCKGFGHFCCVDFIDTAPTEISCYNCGGSGHSGIGCAKPRGESSGVTPPTLCYICGKEGHFARGCTKKSKFDRWPSEPSTPTPRYSKNRKYFGRAKSLPRDFGKGSKFLPHSKGYRKRSMQYEGGVNSTGRKSRIKGGWIVDDPGDLPRRDRESRPWKSQQKKPRESPNTPRTPVQRSYKHYNSAGSSHWNHVY